MMRALVRFCGLATIALFAAPLAAQRTHVLIITGLGGEPQYSARFVEQGRALHELARTQWRVADSSLVWLAEDPTRDPSRIRARSTRDAVNEAFLGLSRRVSPGDVLVVMLIGHGSGEGPASKVNLPGADPTAADYADWLTGFARQTVVFVNSASASGDFVAQLRGDARVIVTATRGPFERNETVFGTYFVRGLTSAEADANKDGRVSVLEAFTYATQEVARVYASEQRLLTEHALVSDSTLAARVAFGGVAASDDPRVVALVAERQALEQQLTVLRGRKESMAPAAYEQELERLLVAIAEKSQEIRAAGGRP